jgi:hypothetical protein
MHAVCRIVDERTRNSVEPAKSLRRPTFDRVVEVWSSSVAVGADWSVVGERSGVGEAC